MPRDFHIVNAPQRSPEWHAARLGRLTGSVAHDIVATIGKGQPAASRRNLLMRLVLERLTGQSQGSTYVSPAMQAGVDDEPAARIAAEWALGCEIRETGFLAHNTLMAGASLDGDIDNFTRLVSLKRRQPNAHYEFLRTGAIPAAARTQMLHELWLTGAESHVYASYNPDFPARLQYWDVVVPRVESEIERYDTLARAFLAEVDREMVAIVAMGPIISALSALKGE